MLQNFDSLERLDRLFCQDKILVIVNGVPGSGKTTLANKLLERYSLTLFSLDEYKAREYKKTGFKSNGERVLLRHKAILNMMNEMRCLSCKGNSMIAEYCFDSTWSFFFEELCNVGGYYSIVVNCISRSEETIFSHIVDRYEGRVPEREKCLQARVYTEDGLFESRWIGKDEYRQKLHDNLVKGTYSEIYGKVNVDDSTVNEMLRITNNK